MVQNTELPLCVLVSEADDHTHVQIHAGVGKVLHGGTVHEDDMVGKGIRHGAEAGTDANDAGAVPGADVRDDALLDVVIKHHPVAQQGNEPFGNPLVKRGVPLQVGVQTQPGKCLIPGGQIAFHQSRRQIHQQLFRLGSDAIE